MHYGQRRNTGSRLAEVKDPRVGSEAYQRHSYSDPQV
jgi:hypothetical protein